MKHILKRGGGEGTLEMICGPERVHVGEYYEGDR